MSNEVFIHGIYPRSEGLVTATQGYDRGRVKPEEVAALQASDRHVLVGLQDPEHFSLIEDGKLTWQDIFRPFNTTTQGFQKEEGNVTRWFDNNAFFRKPVIIGQLIPDFSAL